MPVFVRLFLFIACLFAISSYGARAQDWARAKLEASPRHHEYVNLHSGSRTVQAFVAYPEVKGKAPVVVLIHEIFGLSDWGPRRWPTSLRRRDMWWSSPTC